METLAKHSRVPVWNGLTTEFHPTQMLADMMTVQEHLGSVKGKKLVFMGDARNNVANSLMVVCSKMGMHFTACGPEELFPEQSLIDQCQEFAKASGARLECSSNPEEAVAGADVIYTDVWVSMGEPDEIWEKRIKQLKAYQVNKALMDRANKGAIFLHCLPSFHNTDTIIGKEISEKFGITEMEVTDEVFSSDQSKVMDEAENRLHTIKAVMYATLKDD